MRLAICAVGLAACASSGVGGATHIAIGVAGEFDQAVAHDARGREPHELAFVRGFARWVGEHNYYIANPTIELDGGLGIADSDDRAYDLHARIGSQFSFYPRNGTAHLGGVTAGIGIDAAGAIERAWIVPVDAFWAFHPGTNMLLVGCHGGPRVALTGDRNLGWNAGFDWTMRSFIYSHSNVAPRDLHFSVDVTRFGDSTFFGVSAGLSSRPERNSWSDG